MVTTVNAALFPFEGRFFDRGAGIRMHYLDEGSGDPVVMVHGNPTWSFYYRNLVTALRGSYRTIVPDHVGCGYSDKPSDARYAYTLSHRVDDLDALLQNLHVKGRVTLVLHDWGGMIGMGWAARHPERVARIVLLNTAAFHLPKTKFFPLPLWLARDTALGGFLVERFNAFSRGAAFIGCTKTRMPKDVRDAYIAPYAAAGDRIATLRFVQDIPLRPGDPSFDLVSEIQDKLPLFKDRPIFIGWGGKDFVFDRHFLAHWRALYPHAEVTSIPDAGHYVLEDAAAQLIPGITRFLESHPIALGTS